MSGGFSTAGPTGGRRLLSIAASLLALAACDRGEEELEPLAPTEADQQVKRLRRDNEIEMNDLRGRWVAAHGLLARQRDELKKMAEAQKVREDELRLRVATLEAVQSMLSEEIQSLSATMKDAAGPASTELERLARSYEEIYCLRRRGADEAVASVYERYGFEDEDSWAEAWRAAARSEAFDREVARRVDQLCP